MNRLKLFNIMKKGQIIGKGIPFLNQTIKPENDVEKSVSNR